MLTVLERADRSAARVKRWREANPDRIKAVSDRYRISHPLHSRRTRLKKYGLTLEKYDVLLAAQSGVCAICGTPEPGGKGWSFSVDHDHLTGRVRALLCNVCNIRVGVLESPWAMLGHAYLARTS
jgi:hypothetical protein